jgi:hypothetical protein
VSCHGHVEIFCMAMCGPLSVQITSQLICSNTLFVGLSSCVWQPSVCNTAAGSLHSTVIDCVPVGILAEHLQHAKAADVFLICISCGRNTTVGLARWWMRWPCSSCKCQHCATARVLLLLHQADGIINCVSGQLEIATVIVAGHRCVP